jgi:hypothetical protein
MNTFYRLQSYLVSIRPFLRPKSGVVGSSDDSNSSPNSPVKPSHLSNPAGGSDSKGLVTSAQHDDIFKYGREIDVDWRMAGWVTLRDQVRLAGLVIPYDTELTIRLSLP